jgi:molecular chaperone DnaK (HSP70)
MSTQLTKVYGIDLGTTYSCIACVDEAGKPIVIPNKEGDRVTPSVVFFDGDNVVVGTVARENARVQPDQVVEMFKRNMGDPSFSREFNGKTYTAEEISALVLRKVVSDAEELTGEKIKDVVITIPAYFGVNQREATANAGKIAGLNVREIINEPTAAAIAFGMERTADQTVLVYDLGGGTFDITAIEIKSGAITVLATGGDHNLGGKDWDGSVVGYLIEQFKEQTGSADPLTDNGETMQDLFINAERAKRTLTARDKAPVVVTHAGQRGKVELTRDKFDELTDNWLASTVKFTHDMLNEARMKPGAYTKILLVGGSTHMPQVRKRLEAEFRVPCEIFDPHESVAKGAAIYGWKLALDDKIKIAVAEKTGQKVADVDLDKVNQAVIRQAQEKVARDIDVSLPALRKVCDTEVTNVSSKTFGVVVNVSKTEVKVCNLIMRNQKVPAEVTGKDVLNGRDFTTMEDNQPNILVQLMETTSLERHEELTNCARIGEGVLELPPSMRAGSPIEITFKLNNQGRLEVTAVEPSSKRVCKFEVTTEGVMSAEQVEAARKKSQALSVS